MSWLRTFSFFSAAPEPANCRQAASKQRTQPNVQLRPTRGGGEGARKLCELTGGGGARPSEYTAPPSPPPPRPRGASERTATRCRPRRQTDTRTPCTSILEQGGGGGGERRVPPPFTPHAQHSSWQPRVCKHTRARTDLHLSTPRVHGSVPVLPKCVPLATKPGPQLVAGTPMPAGRAFPCTNAHKRASPRHQPTSNHAH
jgi:hypothetical protein